MLMLNTGMLSIKKLIDDSRIWRFAVFINDFFQSADWLIAQSANHFVILQKFSRYVR